MTRKQCTNCNSILVRYIKRTEDYYCDSCKQPVQIRELVGVHGLELGKNGSRRGCRK